jgi:hypothetical protein
LVSSTDSLIQKVQSFIFLYFILFCFLFWR